MTARIMTLALVGFALSASPATAAITTFYLDFQGDGVGTISQDPPVTHTGYTNIEIAGALTKTTNPSFVLDGTYGLEFTNGLLAWSRTASYQSTDPNNAATLFNDYFIINAGGADANSVMSVTGLDVGDKVNIQVASGRDGGGGIRSNSWTYNAVVTPVNTIALVDLGTVTAAGSSVGATWNNAGAEGNLSHAVISITEAAANVQSGMKIGIDLGPTPTANWNNITSNNAGVAAGSVVDLDGTVVNGVSITTSNAQFTNNDGTNNWIGLSTNGGSAPSEFVDSVTTDIAGNFSLGDGAPYTVTISGLDANLLYDIAAVTTAVNTPIDTITIFGDSTYGPSPVSRPAAQSLGLFHEFDYVRPDGSGTIRIEVYDSGAGANPILNGVLLTVIPAPAALPAGLAMLGLVAARRRRRNA